MEAILREVKLGQSWVFGVGKDIHLTIRVSLPPDGQVDWLLLNLRTGDVWRSLSITLDLATNWKLLL